MAVVYAFVKLGENAYWTNLLRVSALFEDLKSYYDGAATLLYSCDEIQFWSEDGIVVKILN